MSFAIGPVEEAVGVEEADVVEKDLLWYGGQHFDQNRVDAANGVLPDAHWNVNRFHWARFFDAAFDL